MSVSANQSRVSIADVEAAAKRLQGVAHQTPVITNGSLDRITGKQLFFKCENLQKAGAFKFRGAYNTLSQLDAGQRSRGVVTHSSGNHAGALALAARLVGTTAHVVMPRSASPVKRAAVEEYGGHVIECEPTLASRDSTAEQVRIETGATFVHPFDQASIIAGQGTAALELISQTEKLDAIIAPVGGGGLISGTCIAAAARGNIRVIAAEPAGADDAARSKKSGQLIEQTSPDTIADGLLTSLGQLTWPFVRDHVEAVITVTDDEIISAMKLFWERTKLIIEPSSATVLAAIRSPKFAEFTDVNRIALILSGGNVNLDQLPFHS